MNVPYAYLMKTAAWAEHLAHDDRNRLMLANHPAKDPHIAAFDADNARQGFSVGEKLGAGFQGNVHPIAPHPDGKPAFDPAGHVAKLYHVQSGHMLAAVSPFMGREPLHPDQIPHDVVLKPVARSTMEVPARPGMGGGKMFQDIMEKGDPHAYDRLPSARRAEVAHHTATRLAEQGYVHEDFRPEQFLHMSGPKYADPGHPLAHAGGQFRIGDLGGLRKLTAEERTVHPSVHVGRMMLDWHIKGQLSKMAPPGVESTLEHGISAFNNRDFVTAGAHLPPEVRGVHNIPKLLQLGAGAVMSHRPEVDAAYHASRGVLPQLSAALGRNPLAALLRG